MVIVEVSGLDGRADGCDNSIKGGVGEDGTQGVSSENFVFPEVMMEFALI